MNWQFGWTEEVLHARIGRDWYVMDMPSAKAAIEYGDECWSAVLDKWREWKDKGLTYHRNWWPDLYRAWCVIKGITPDAALLAFDQSYESKRPF